MKAPRLGAAKFRMRSLTPHEHEQAAILYEALDASSEFGLETASRERLLVRLGELTALLRLLRNRVGR